MELSKRLQGVADFVSPCPVICDIGCDHGYVSIYLAESKRANRVIAMDVNEGPLQQAKLNVAHSVVSDKIEFRLSDGLSAVREREADGFICAGMGGRLVCKIMRQGSLVMQQMSFAILQPQSEIDIVRNYIYEIGWHIEAEDMILEDGKYYPIMKIVPGKSESLTKEEAMYGPLLLKERHPVLLDYLDSQIRLKDELAKKLEENKVEASKLRAAELRNELQYIRRIRNGESYDL